MAVAKLERQAAVDVWATFIGSLPRRGPPLTRAVSQRKPDTEFESRVHAILTEVAEETRLAART
jgi:hypothetical protein